MRYALPAAILALGLGLSACQPTVVETNDPPAVVVAPAASLAADRAPDGSSVPARSCLRPRQRSPLAAAPAPGFGPP